MVPPELGEYISANAATLPGLLDAATYAPGRYRPVVDVHLVLTDGEKVLLGRRHGTGYADGEWQIMPSGHLEEGETITDAAAREAREELGIEVGDCTVVHVMHHRNPGGTARIGMFLLPRSVIGTPVNAEPHKCAELDWFPLDRLPERTVPYSRAGVAAVRRALAAASSGVPGGSAHDVPHHALAGAASARGAGPGLAVTPPEAALLASGSTAFSLHGWDVPGPADLAAEAVRAGFEEITVCLTGWLDGAVLVHSDDETDRLPATVVRPGEAVEAALARLAPIGEATFVGADDYVSATGRNGRRLAFSAALTTAPEGMVALPPGSVGRLPYAEGVFVRRASGLLPGLPGR
ncbi:MAG: NUDIX domain-containing protein [Microbispora sp.]|nr:NUDIX domain-containing protein [Microbispora sp.]